MPMAKSTTRKRTGSGRLVPSLPTGVQYRVRYGLQIIEGESPHGRGVRPHRWERCSVKSETAHKIPDGLYFLHADEGGVFQVKLSGNSWQYLAVAA
jgi:hypothetical protein